MKEMQY